MKKKIKRKHSRKFLSRSPRIYLYGKRKDPWKKKDGKQGSFKSRFNKWFAKDARVYVPGGWAKDIFFLVQHSKYRAIFKSLYAENGELHIEVETSNLFVLEECRRVKKLCSRTCQVCSSRKNTDLLQWKDQVLRVCPVCREKKLNSRSLRPKKPPEERKPRATPIRIALKNKENKRIFEYHEKKRPINTILEHLLFCIKNRNREASQFLFDITVNHFYRNHYREKILAIALLMGGYENIMAAIKLQHKENAQYYWDIYNELRFMSRGLAAALLEKMEFPLRQQKTIYPELAKHVGWERLINAKINDDHFPILVVPPKFQHMLKNHPSTKRREKRLKKS